MIKSPYSFLLYILKILLVKFKIFLPSPLPEPIPVLCKGKLVNACGLGKLCKVHSKPKLHLSLNILK